MERIDRTKPFAFRLSTDDFPEKDRITVWTEEFGKTLFKIDIETQRDVPFFQHATMRKLDGLSMTVGEGSAICAYRTRNHIAHSVNDYMFHVHLGGRGKFIQAGHEALFGPGDAVLASGEEVTHVVYPDNFKFLTLCVPRDALADRLRDAGTAILRPARNNEAVRLLTGYLAVLDSAEAAPAELEATPGLLPAFVTHVHDLIGIALGANREASHAGHLRGVRAARLHAIKHDVSADLASSHSITSVAARHGVSPRYVQALFAAEGTTFTEFVMNGRLAHARRLLEDTRFDGHTIGAIAFEAGFADLSNFNRAFRQKYGFTPSDARASARK